MQYLLKPLNSQVVEPIAVPHLNPDRIKGYDVIPWLHANIFICGKKGSGKTNVLFKLLKNCINKNTRVFIFCATLHSDPNWLIILKWLKARKQPMELFDEIYVGKGKNAQSHLKDVVDGIMLEAKERQEALEQQGPNKKPPVCPSLLLDEVAPPPEEKDRKEKKPKSVQLYPAWSESERQ